MRGIYLDNNATTRLAPRVADEMAQCLRAGYANPASMHAAGRAARRRLEEARESIGRAVGARLDTHAADRVVLTSGATESNNLALRGLAAAGQGQVVVSAVEHPSLRGAAAALQAAGRKVAVLPVSRDGVADLDHLQQLLRDPTAVVSLMLANNETGVVQPVAEAAALCAARGVPLHCDAVQAVGKVDVGFARLGVSAMSFNAHKLHGPVGIGALILRSGVQPQPLLRGGQQQLGLRPGTESVPLTVGLAAALQLWLEEGERRTRRLTRLRTLLEELLLQDSRAVIVGSGAERMPHTTNVAFRGCDRQALLLALDMRGVACSTGSACASGSSEPSPVLQAMGLDEPIVEGSIRLSLGADSTEHDVREGARLIVEAAGEMT